MEAEEAIVHVAGSTPGHGSNSDSTSGLPQTEPLALSTPPTGTLIGSSDAEHDEASEAASLLHDDVLSKASSVGADAPLAATPANPVLAPLSPPGNGPPPLDPSAASAPEPDKAQRGSTCAYICVICTGIVAAVVFVGFIAAALYRGVHYGGAVTDVGPVLSSPTDDRSFSYIQLENGLQAMLISDPDAESAAAALDVRVGSWYDPKTFPGLAHMVEHGLFLGTLPYPGENEYNAYLASNGGSSNAYTDLEDTNYFFSVAAGGLEGALDRFAQFFIAPTFNDSSMARELKAVDSEHRKNLQSDTWRRYQLLKHVSSPDTPFNSFSTGDLETLNKPGVRAAMLAFHAAHYAAPRMRLAVVGNQPLDTLAEWVAGKFSPIASVPRTFKFAPAPAGSSIAAGGEAEVVVVTDSAVIKRSSSATGSGNPTDLYATVPASQLRAAIADVNATGVVGRASNETLAPERVFPPSSSRGVRLLVSPIADAHKMTAYFPLPAQATADAARVGALSFITSVLGDEGAGSPLSYLKAAGLGESVSAGEEVDSTGFALMAIDVTISPAVVDAARAAGSPAAAAAVLTAASDRILAVLFAHVRLATQELETAISQSIAALRKTGNVDLLCGAGTHPTLNLTQMTAGYRANSGAVHLTSAGATTDALGICRDHRGRLVHWPGDAATSAAYRVWGEAQHMALLQFRYPSKGDPSHLASHLAKAMHRAGPNDILTPPSRRVWQPRAIHLMLQHIVPANALVLLSSKVLDASLLPQTEPIYGSRYDMQPLPPATLAALAGADPLALLPAGSPRPHLALPLTNPFLPSDFSLVRHGSYASALGLADIDAIAASQPVGGPGGPLSVAGAMGAALGQEHMRSNSGSGSDSRSGSSSVVGVAGAAGRISQQQQQQHGQHVHQAQLPHPHAAAGARFAQRRAAGAGSGADADADAGAEGSGSGAASSSSSGSGSGAGAEEGESLGELLSEGEGEGNDASEAQSHSQSGSTGGRSTVVIKKAGSSGRSSGSGAVVRAAGSEPQTDSRIGAPKASDDAAAVAARLRAMLLPINDMLPALGLAPPAPVPSPAPKVKGKAAAAHEQMSAAEQEHWGVSAQLASLGGPAPTPGASPAPPSSSTTSSTPATAAVVTGYAAGYTPPISLWWMPDAFFGRPRSYMVLEVTAPAAAASATAHILSVLYVAALRDALREVGYAAARGGTSFAVTSLSFASGISFSVESYSQVMPLAVDAMLPRLLAANGTAGRASADLKLLVQGLRNGAKEQPYSRALQQLDVLTGARRFTTAQLLAAAASVAGVSSQAAAAGEFTVPNPSALAAAVTSHAQALWGDTRTITLFVYGNENTTTARALGGHALARLMDSPLLQPFRARASAGAGAGGGSGGGSASGGSAAAAARAPSAVVPAESFVEVRSLPASGRTTLLMHGENPDDVNSAAVTAFQVGLRDTCAVTAPPVQLIGQAATPPASAAAAIAAAKAIGQGTAGHVFAGGGPRSLHKSGAAGAGAAGKSPAPSPSSHPKPSPSAAAPAASPSGAPGAEQGKDGGDDGSGDEYRSSGKGKGKESSTSKTAAGADAGAAAAVAHGAAHQQQQQQRHRQREPQPLPQSFLQLAERARATVVSAGAAAARVLAPAAASPDEMRAAVLTASGAVANLHAVPAAGAGADAATAAQPARAEAAAGHAAGGKAAPAVASTPLSQDALDAALVKEFRRRRSAARRVFEGWEHGLSDAAAAALAADAAAAAGNKAAAVAAGGVTASLGSASSASSAVGASAASAALASASAASASSQGRTLASFSDAELTAAAAELDRDCDVRNAALDMLEQLVRDPAFTELRTQRQLGYIVFGIARHADGRLPDAAVMHRPVTALTFGGYDAHAASPVGAPTSAAAAAATAAHLGVNASTAGHGRFAEGALSVGAVSRAALGDSMQSLVVLVQGAAAGADVMDDAIAAFSYHFEAFLRSMDAATWTAAVNGVRSVARRLPVSMSEAFLWEWEEIGRRSFRSSRRVDEAKALRRVTMAHVLALYRRVMHPDAGARIATVDVFGKGKTLAAPTGAGAPTFLLERTR